MVQLSATRCSCIVTFVSQSSEFCRHNPLCYMSISVVAVYFVIDSVRKLLDVSSYEYPYGKDVHIHFIYISNGIVVLHETEVIKSNTIGSN
jgi:hypothetical protein